MTPDPASQRESPSRPRPDRRMLDLLVCPLTKGVLHYDEAAGELVSPAAKLAYPVRQGIAILLPSEARVLSDDPVPPPVADASTRHQNRPDQTNNSRES